MTALSGGNEGGDAEVPDSTLQQRFHQAEELIAQGKSDSASTLLTRVYKSLQLTGRHDTPFGLWVRLKRARAWERSRAYASATRELHDVIDKSIELDQPAVCAHAYLNMALIHEQRDDSYQTLKYLKLARKLIEQRKLVDIEARLWTRYASYHRLFGRHGKALYYSKKALRKASETDQATEQAIAHLLLSMLYRDSLPTLSEQHLHQAGILHRSVKNPVFSLVVSLHLGDLYFHAGDYERALMSNDSALYYIDQASDQRSEANAFIGRLYDDRGRILRATGHYDSAFHYLALGRNEELKSANRSSAERIAEIEALYDSEKKLKVIEEKEAELAYQLKRESWVNRFLIFILGALLLLGIYYLRLRAANQQLAEQSEIIRDNNERLNRSLKEQELLRGELHHRIKNNLQVIIGLLDMQLDELHDPQTREDLQSLAGRVHSMAAIHDVLYREVSLSEISFLGYVRHICDHFARIAGQGEDCRYVMDLPDFKFNLDTLLPLGTMLNELLMNSYKYATLAGQRLEIHLSLSQSGETFTLTYRDNGPGFPPGFATGRKGSLGMHLLRGLSRQLNGQLSMYNDGGAVTIIHFATKNQWSASDRLGQSRTKPAPLRT